MPRTGRFSGVRKVRAQRAIARGVTKRSPVTQANLRAKIAQKKLVTKVRMNSPVTKAKARAKATARSGVARSLGRRLR